MLLILFHCSFLIFYKIVGLGRVEDAWTKCLMYGRCVKSISQMGNMYSGRLWIWRRPMILSINIADAKSVELEENC